VEVIGGDSVRAYLAEHVLGVFAYDDEGKLIAKKLHPRDFELLIEENLKFEDGALTKAHEDVLKELKEKGYKDIVVEAEDIASHISKLGFNVVVEPRHKGAEILRENIVKYAIEEGLVKTPEEYYEFLSRITIELTRRKIKRAAGKKDLLAAQGIRAIDDIDRTINLFAARLREWYSLHFPELNELVREHEDYIRIVAELGSRSNLTIDALKKLGFSEGKARRIVEAAKKSMGADISEEDIIPMQTLAKIVLELYKLRSDIADYIDTVMKEVAPNVTALVGPLLGARLLSLAGGLDELAKLPASTIQVLGAEKALFRALRTGGKPPKHGVIFQFPYIHKSPRWQRGKIARALAAKLAIAAKVDAFTGRYIGDKLREDLMKRIEEIKQLYPKPPKRKLEERKRVEEKRVPKRKKRRKR